jgi:nucleotide-binding universal stress UspA family protein
MLASSQPDLETPGLLDGPLGGTVVVGFEGSPGAARALDVVANALAPSARMVIVAVEPEVHSGGLLAEPLLGSGAAADSWLAAARDRLRDLDRPFRVEMVARRGDPRTALVQIAREKHASLVALGGRGDDFEARVLLGSVAAYVAEHAHCDVLIVR